MSTAFPNEPTGSVLVTDWGHTAVVGSGWTDVYDTTGYQATIVSDPTAPLSPNSVLRQRFPAGLVGGNGGGGGTFYNFGTSYDQIFFGFRFKTDPNFEQHPVFTKLAWMHTTLNGVAQLNQLFLGLVGNNPYYVNANYQQSNIDNSHLFGGPIGTIRIDPTVSSTFAAGTWATIETYFKQSTSNTSRNGIWKVWVNGTQTINITNLNTDRITVDSVSYITIWGGTGSTKTRDSYFYWDHSYVSAPAGSGAPPPLVEPTNLYPRNITLPYGPTTWSWSPVAGAANYAIRIHEVGTPYEPSGSLLAYATQAGTTITRTTLPSKQYDWWVYAIDGSGTDGPSAGGVLTTSADTTLPGPDPDPEPDPPPPPPVDPPVDPPPPVVIPPVDPADPSTLPPDPLPQPQVLGTATVIVTIKDRQNPIKKEFHFYG